jgi:hypothetical protein
MAYMYNALFVQEKWAFKVVSATTGNGIEHEFCLTNAGAPGRLYTIHGTHLLSKLELNIGELGCNNHSAARPKKKINK